MIMKDSKGQVKRGDNTEDNEKRYHSPKLIRYGDIRTYTMSPSFGEAESTPGDLRKPPGGP